MIENHFERKHHKKQETSNNCFVSIKCSTTLLQVITGEHECRVRCCYFSALLLTCYRLKKGRATFYRPETIVLSLLFLMVLSFKVIFNHISKCQFVVLHFCKIGWFRKNPAPWPEVYCTMFDSKQ